jgi:hypothetical protein
VRSPLRSWTQSRYYRSWSRYFPGTCRHRWYRFQSLATRPGCLASASQTGEWISPDAWGEQIRRQCMVEDLSVRVCPPCSCRCYRLERPKHPGRQAFATYISRETFRRRLHDEDHIAWVTTLESTSNRQSWELSFVRAELLAAAHSALAARPAILLGIHVNRLTYPLVMATFA